MNGDKDFRLGARFFEQRDYERARIYFERAAQQNNRSALNHLGNLYELGRGVQQDYERSRGYY